MVSQIRGKKSSILILGGKREKACIERGIMADRQGVKKEVDVCELWPLLAPSGPRRTVHSSIWPKDSNSRRTSSSLCCLPSIPTNSFLSSGCIGRGEKDRKRKVEETSQQSSVQNSALGVIAVDLTVVWCATSSKLYSSFFSVSFSSRNVLYFPLKSTQISGYVIPTDKPLDSLHASLSHSVK